MFGVHFDASGVVGVLAPDCSELFNVFDVRLQWTVLAIEEPFELLD